MTVLVEEWQYQIALRTLALDLKDRAGRGRLANQIRQAMNQSAATSTIPAPGNLQYYIDTYGEQVTADAIADINKYFTQTQAQGFTIGGLSTQVPPLWIGPGDVRPSNTAISVIGEGLSGWYLETQGLQPLARPIGEPVDFLFEVPQTRPRRYALVQVKATQEPSIETQIRSAVLELLDYALKVAVGTPGDTYSCEVFGVVIGQSGNFNTLRLTIDLV